MTASERNEQLEISSRIKQITHVYIKLHLSDTLAVKLTSHSVHMFPKLVELAKHSQMTEHPPLVLMRLGFYDCDIPHGFFSLFQ